MTALRRVAIGYIAAIFLLALGASLITPHHYAEQFRDHTGEPPSTRFYLGTDDLGRDRFSRLLFATQVSLLIAPANAAVTSVLVLLLGLVSGWRRGWIDSAVTAASELLLSLPLLFLVLTLRSLLPLDVGPFLSIVSLGGLLAVVGWASGARVIRGIVFALRSSPSILHAKSYGCRPLRLMRVYVVPQLRGPMAAQFWILVPAFVLAEANLGILGLGISEPVPSLGNLLAELRDYERILEAPWMLMPAALLVSVLTALHFAVSGSDR